MHAAVVSDAAICSLIAKPIREERQRISVDQALISNRFIVLQLVPPSEEPLYQIHRGLQQNDADFI